MKPAGLKETFHESATLEKPGGNPLLSPSPLPHGAPPFQHIKASHFLPALEAAMRAARHHIAKIKESPAGFHATVAALETAGLEIDRIDNLFNIMIGNARTKWLSNIQDRLDHCLTEYKSEVFTDPDLFARVEEVYCQRDALNLTVPEKTLVENTYRKFILAGARLNDADKKELLDVNRALTEKENMFLGNLAAEQEETYCRITDADDLAGLPEHAKDAYAAAAARRGFPGEWVVELTPPPDEVWEYADREHLRRGIYHLKHRQCHGGPRDNRAVLMEIIRLRGRKARLLGFENYAELSLSGSMIGGVAEMRAFLDKIGAFYKERMRGVTALVHQRAAEDGVENPEEWDFEYFHRKQKEEKFKINPKKMLSHFNMDSVTQGIFRCQNKLFHLRFCDKTEDYQTLDEKTRVYEVHDAGGFAGLIYFDPLSRPGRKDSNNSVQVLQERNGAGPGSCPILYAGFDMPKTSDDRSPEMDVYRIELFFHEFGHALHSLLSGNGYATQNGTNVSVDFMETPSQLMESCGRHIDALRLCAHADADGLWPSDAEMENWIRHERYHMVCTEMHLYYLTLLDLAWHTTDPETIESVEALENKVRQDVGMAPCPEGGSTSMHFDYLVGYAGVFYSYLYSSMLESDIFERMEKNGLYDADFAAKLRAFYAAGGNAPPHDLFHDLMGRAPDMQPLFRRQGPADEVEEENAAVGRPVRFLKRVP